jgi:thiol-disulfide isomerase/thioredoxin
VLRVVLLPALQEAWRERAGLFRSARRGARRAQDRAMRRRAALLTLAAMPWARAAEEGPKPVTWPASRRTPGFELAAWAGPPVALAALRGRPVLLNFWASWCQPCRAELPSLELLATRFEGDGLEVLAVNFRETDAPLRRFIDETGLTLPVLRDRDGAVAQAFGVRVFPSSIAIGRDGRARFTVTGEVDWSGPPARSWMTPIVSRS